MMRKHTETVRTARLPKHLAEIGMTVEQYFELKVYIKSIILPGTPAFEGDRFDGKDSVYRQWLHIALEEIGPRFFPKDGNGLVWPEDYDGISQAVHQVVRNFSFHIKRYYQRAGLTVSGSGAEGGKAEMIRDGERYERGGSDDTDLEEDVTMADEELGSEMDAAALELEDLLSLMQPEAFSQFPDLPDECFDWDEVEDSNTLDSIGGLFLTLGQLIDTFLVTFDTSDSDSDCSACCSSTGDRGTGMSLLFRSHSFSFLPCYNSFYLPQSPSMSPAYFYVPTSLYATLRFPNISLTPIISPFFPLFFPLS